MRRTRWLRPILAVILWVVVGHVAQAEPYPYGFSNITDGAFSWFDQEATASQTPIHPPWIFSLDSQHARPQVDLETSQRTGVSDVTPALAWERASRDPRKSQTQTDENWGVVSSKVVIDAPPAWDDPLARREWKRDDSVKVTVAGPFFVFGQFGAASAEAEQQDMKVNGKTGLACKLTLFSEGEIVLRSGPNVAYSDPLRAERVKEKSEWLLEVQARWPILATIGLEYQGTAAPALSPQDRDRINQDLGFAMPFGPGGKLRLGARHKWENTGTPKAFSDGMQLYLGYEWER